MRFNLNLLECKLISPHYILFAAACFNLNLLECKSLCIFVSLVPLAVLISTYWNVNEDNSEFIRLHIYTADSRKLGTVKISKSDMTIQYKKIGQDAYIIKTADELKKYIM